VEEVGDDAEEVHVYAHGGDGVVVKGKSTGSGKRALWRS
jgi:hypothetical protein